MGVRTCPDCGGKVSDSRNDCPHCGYVFPKTSVNTSGFGTFNQSQQDVKMECVPLDDEPKSANTRYASGTQTSASNNYAKFSQQSGRASSTEKKAHLVEKVIDEKEFLRRACIELAKAKYSLSNLTLGEVEESRQAVFFGRCKVHGPYSGYSGTDRTEIYYVQEQVWRNGKWQSENVKKTRTVTDWNLYQGYYDSHDVGIATFNLDGDPKYTQCLPDIRYGNSEKEIETETDGVPLDDLTRERLCEDAKIGAEAHADIPGDHSKDKSCDFSSSLESWECVIYPCYRVKVTEEDGHEFYVYGYAGNFNKINIARDRYSDFEEQETALTYSCWEQYENHKKKVLKPMKTVKWTFLSLAILFAVGMLYAFFVRKTPAGKICLIVFGALFVVSLSVFIFETVLYSLLEGDIIRRHSQYDEFLRKGYKALPFISLIEKFNELGFELKDSEYDKEAVGNFDGKQLIALADKTMKEELEFPKLFGKNKHNEFVYDKDSAGAHIKARAKKKKIAIGVSASSVAVLIVAFVLICVFTISPFAGGGHLGGNRPVEIVPDVNEIESFGFEFELTYGGYRATAYTGSSNRVDIPAEYNGSPVVEVGESLFYGNSRLEYVFIPSSVTRIGNYAFSDCTALETVYIHDVGESCDIGDYAFYGCESLESIDMPYRVSSIGSYAFYDCTNLKNVSISKGTTSIGDRAFGNCSSIETIVIPYSVTYIGERAFVFCNIEKTYYYGDKRNLQDVDGYSELKGTIYYYSYLYPYDDPSDENHYWYSVDNNDVHEWEKD